MGYGRFQRDRATKEEFFEKNSVNCTKKYLAEQSYILIHTIYLKDGVKIKTELKNGWEQMFGLCMESEMYEYMLTNAPIFLRYTLVDQVKALQEITSMKSLVKTIVSLEFDLWLIERNRIGLSLDIHQFDEFLHEKYGSFLDQQYRNFKFYDLAFVEDFSELAKGLDAYYEKIKEFLSLIQKANGKKIEFNYENTERTKNYETKALPTESEKDNPVANKESDTGKLSVEEEKAAISQVQKVSDTVESTDADMAQIRQRIEREFQIILKEKEECIEKLEQDIKEFKRQRDEVREYSANQYDRGIKDLFMALNDVRYGKVIDYLYGLLLAEDTDERLAGYLDNLFMILEDMEIEPMVEKGEPVIKEEYLVRDFNLDFDKNEYDAEKVRLKYAGWKYKEIPMEKPTLTMD